MAKLATTSQEDLDKRIPVKHLLEPSININSEEIIPVMTVHSWMDLICYYLLNGTLLSDPNEASKLRARSARFTLLQGTLYKRGFSAPLLKCIGKEDVNYVLREVHEGVYGNHIRARTLVGKTLRQGYYWPTRSARFTLLQGTLYKRGFSAPLLKCIGKEDVNYVLREVHEGVYGNHIRARTLVGKTLRQGYYWPTMLKDAAELVRKFKICQEHAKISYLPFEPLTSIISPWPFQQWALDILGPLLVGRGQCKFTIVGVDYFTKWV